MAKRILLIRLSALGDVIFTLPTLEALREKHPGAALTWLVEDKASSLLLHRMDLDRVVVYPRMAIQKALRNPLRWITLPWILARHLGALRKESYDLALDFQGNLKSAIHLLFTRARTSRGYAREYVKELNHWFTREHVRPSPAVRHRIEKSFSLVNPDFQEGDIRRPELYLPPELIEEAQRMLKELGSDRGPWMVVHPGTSAFGAYKRWAPDKFGSLAGRLARERGFSTLVTWGPGERHLAEEVARTGGEDVIVAPTTRSLQHLAALFTLGKVYVGADSGPLHLANYLGVPCLALFGPKDPALYRPYFSPSRVVRSDVDCSPCTRRSCDDPICMKKLEVDDVYNALCVLLDESCRSA
jgi:heptosyltransferase-1